MLCCLLFQVVGVQQYLVKPRVADINENVLSEQIVSESTLTEDLVKSGMPLEAAIQQVSQLSTSQIGVPLGYIAKKLLCL